MNLQFFSLMNSKHKQLAYLQEENSSENINVNIQEENKSIEEEFREQSKGLSQNKCDCKEILIVDDNDFNIFSLETIVNDTYTLYSSHCYNGKDAVEAVKKKMNDTEC
mmetsp:Transcript_34541/g.33738  ORF Transcript_34541/g.33738 Transcript_34541/m.33738 type:complete len:108 (-) Transcript_34541:316-639(-)